MKILILSCGTGAGHDSAAKAVKEALCDKGAKCEMLNPLSFGRKHTSKIVDDAYNKTIKNIPALFGAIYKLGSAYSSSKLPSPVYFANTRYAKKLKGYITSNHFDAVVCTHLFALEALTYLKKDKTFTVPCYGILTDYTCIPFFAETNVDEYFIPHGDIADEVVKKGLKKEQLIATGIPVRKKFSDPIDRFTARIRLNIPQNKPCVLIMCGGVGCGRIIQLLKNFVNRFDDKYFLCVLAGRNKQMKTQIEQTFKDNKNVTAVPFTNETYLYMKAADVLITKPGGLSSTEAAVANIPLIHLLAYSGCETKNAEFFSSRNMSVYAKDIDDAVIFADKIISDKEFANNIRQSQTHNVPKGASDDIAYRVMNNGIKRNT